ncbi:MAG: DUF4143 domain-containing protein [Pseudomonadota bacterium]
MTVSGEDVQSVPGWAADARGLWRLRVVTQAAICGVSRPTIAAWLSLLEESHVIRLVRPFAGGRRAELTHNPKVYFCDNGLLCAMLGRFEPFAERPDRRALFENWVGAEIMKHLGTLGPRDALRFWRSKAGAEVDFNAEADDGIVGVEVSAGLRPQPKLIEPARAAPCLRGEAASPRIAGAPPSPRPIGARACGA